MADGESPAAAHERATALLGKKHPTKARHARQAASSEVPPTRGAGVERRGQRRLRSSQVALY